MADNLGWEAAAGSVLLGEGSELGVGLGLEVHLGLKVVDDFSNFGMRPQKLHVVAAALDAVTGPDEDRHFPEDPTVPGLRNGVLAPLPGLQFLLEVLEEDDVLLLLLLVPGALLPAVRAAGGLFGAGEAASGHFGFAGAGTALHNCIVY